MSSIWMTDAESKFFRARSEESRFDGSKPPFKVGDELECLINNSGYRKDKVYVVTVTAVNPGGEFRRISTRQKDNGYENGWNTWMFELIKSNCSSCNNTGNSGFMYVIKCKCGL